MALCVFNWINDNNTFTNRTIEDTSFTFPYLWKRKLNRSTSNYMLLALHRAQNHAVYGRLCPTGLACRSSSFRFITVKPDLFFCCLMQRRGCFLHFKSRPVYCIDSLHNCVWIGQNILLKLIIIVISSKCCLWL